MLALAACRCGKGHWELGDNEGRLMLVLCMCPKHVKYARDGAVCTCYGRVRPAVDGLPARGAWGRFLYGFDTAPRAGRSRHMDSHSSHSLLSMPHNPVAALGPPRQYLSSRTERDLAPCGAAGSLLILNTYKIMRGRPFVAIPSINKILTPLLVYLESGESRLPHEVLDHICEKFNLTDNEMNMRNTSGTNTKIKNRVVWAKMTLKQAGLLATLPEGGWQITDLGTRKLRSGFRPNINNIKPLVRSVQGVHEEVTDAARAGREANAGLGSDGGDADGGDADGGDADGGDADGGDADGGDADGGDADQTPHEKIDAAVREIRESVLDDILEKARHSRPHYFERIVVNLLEKMGYGKGETVGGSGDRGIDGVLVMDELGLDMIFVQAKRTTSSIKSKTMREFVGALDPQKSKKGVFITTSDFTPEALAVVKNTRHPIVAIDGRRLAELMYDHNVGCEVESRVETKRVDDDFFRG